MIGVALETQGVVIAHVLGRKNAERLTSDFEKIS